MASSEWELPQDAAVGGVRWLLPWANMPEPACMRQPLPIRQSLLFGAGHQQGSSLPACSLPMGT